MKKLIVAFALVVAFALPVWGADTKITGLGADTTPTTDDLVVTVDAPGTSPVNKKVTLGNFATAIKGLINPMDSAGDLIYGGASGAWTKLDAGTDGYILQAKGAAAPQWVNSLTGLTFGGFTASRGIVSDGSGNLVVTTANLTLGTNLTTQTGAITLTGQAGGSSVTLPASGTLQTVKTEKIASFAWDGGGSAVATANSKRCVLIPVAYTVTGYNMVVDQDPGAGTTILNLDKDAIGDGTALATTDMDGSSHSYPPTMPDNKVAVNDTTITGWTTSVSANDMICATVATNAVATWISLSIYGTK